jgi:hypothetical protein
MRGGRFFLKMVATYGLPVGSPQWDTPTQRRNLPLLNHDMVANPQLKNYTGLGLNPGLSCSHRLRLTAVPQVMLPQQFVCSEQFKKKKIHGIGFEPGIIVLTQTAPHCCATGDTDATICMF